MRPAASWSRFPGWTSHQTARKSTKTRVALPRRVHSAILKTRCALLFASRLGRASEVVGGGSEPFTTAAILRHPRGICTYVHRAIQDSSPRAQPWDAREPLERVWHAGSSQELPQRATQDSN